MESWKEEIGEGERGGVETCNLIMLIDDNLLQK